MEQTDFGKRLQELRRKAGLSQRQLATKVGVNYSYLSKIESGKMPPPREQIIIRLAEALNVDKDELLALAGRIPPDIAQILKNREALEILRSKSIKRKILSNKEGGGKMKKLLNYRALSKIAVPIVLVLAVAVSLWYVAPQPARALDIDITPPSSGTLGSTHSFTTSITIDVNKVLPIQTINMEIYYVNSPNDYKVTCANLPKEDGGSATYSTSGGVVTVTASSPTLFAYFSGAGYAYWRGVGYDFGATFGYGYSSSPSANQGKLSYSVTWTSPSSWPEGSYKIKLTINAASGSNSESFIQTSSAFTLSGVPGGGDGGGGALPISGGKVNVADVITQEGIFITNVSVESENKLVSLQIDRGTTGKQESGLALRIISIIPMDTPPDPPENTNVIGLTYDMQPDGATFDPAITLTFTYDPTEVTDLDNLVIAMYDSEAGEWIILEDCVVDPVTNTITAPVSHFTAFSTLETTAAPAVEEPVEEEEEEEVVEEEEEEEIVEEEEEEVVEEEEEEEVVEEEEEEVVEEEEEEVEPTGIAWWVWLIIGIAVIVVIELVYFLWWKRR